MRVWIYSAVVLAVGASLIYVRQHRAQPNEAVFVTAPPPEVVPLCPWREPEADLKRFFPEATHHHTETKILSAQRVELTQALGRPPAPDEHALQLHRILQNDQIVGTVLTRRVKGEAGAIELVLAVKSDGRVAGLRLQRLREPQTVASALEDEKWLAAFAGKNASSKWQLGADIPELSSEAHASALAIVDNVRSLLILLEMAEKGASADHHV